MREPWVVGVSGASGTPYAAAVIRGLLDAGEAVDLVVSRAARLTIMDETGRPFRDGHWERDLADWLGRDLSGADVRHWAAGDLAAGPSSGSYPVRGMAVVPASTAACAGIAIGLSKDLLQRAAEVNLKERRRVVVVPRETPVTRSHLEHLIALHDAGAVVLPASPGFYGAGARRAGRSSSTSWPGRSSTRSVSSMTCFVAGAETWAPATARDDRPRSQYGPLLPCPGTP